MAINGRRIKKSILALTALMLLLAPQLVCMSAWAVDPVMADPPTAPSNAGTTAPAATGLTDTDTQTYDAPSTNTVSESAEQDKSSVITNTTNTLMQAIDQRSSGRNTEVYNGMAAWVGDDIFSNLFQNVGQVIGRWLSEFIDGWISSTVQFLAAFLRTFVLNPNIAVNGVQNTPGATGQPDDISPYVREAAGTMYGIAIDLLLLLFILCIWKFWAEAAWRGGGHLLGAVGRLIFTAGLMLAWPTIYAFEIQITNEMIKAIYFTGGDQITQLDVALTAAVKAGLVATTGLLANAFAPVIGGAVGGAVGGTVGGIIAFAGLIIYLILGVVLITQIVYILVLKAIQTGLLTAQYMFAPIFLVFFATPDTENVTSGFVKSFVEVSLWTFVWVGLLKIMVIILYSQFNPWGKITMAVGILQIMIQVPTFLARAQISPMSDFISAGLVTGGLMKGASALANKAAGAMTQFSRYVTSDMYAASGMPTSKKTGITNTPSGAANPELMNSLKTAGQGVTPGGAGKGGIPGAGAQDLVNPLSKVPAKKTGDALKDKLGAEGLGAPGKSVNPLNATAASESANAMKKLSPADQAAAMALKAGVPVALAAGVAAGEAGALGKDPATAQMSPEEAKLRKQADRDSVMPGVPVVPAKKPDGTATGDAAKAGVNKPADPTLAALAGNRPTPPGATTKKTAASGIPGVTPPATTNLNKAEPGSTDKDTARNLADGENAQNVNTTAVPGTPGAASPPKVKPGETKNQEGKTPELPGAVPTALAAGALGALPTAMNAARSRNNLLNGAQQGKPLAAAGSGGLNADGTKSATTVEQTARVPVTGGSDEQQQNVNNLLNADGSPKPPAASVKQGATTTTLGTAGIGGALTNPDGTPSLAALASLAPTIKRPGETASMGRKGALPGGGASAISNASSDFSTRNGSNVDPLTVRQAAYTPAGAATDRQGQNVNVEEVPGGRHQQGGANQGGNPTVRSISSVPAAAGDFNPANSALAGLTGAAGMAAGMAAANAARTAANGGGGNRNVSLPGSAAGGGGGGFGGGGNDTAHVSFTNPGTGPTRGGRPITTDGMTNFDQANYRWVPGRGLLTDIRTAAGPQQGDAADGQSAITMGQRGVASVRYGQGATSEQKALMLMTAGYAGVFSQDPAAFDAARQSAIDAGGDQPKGLAQRIASNWLQYSGGSFKSTAIAKNQFQQTLMEQATTGAESYVNGQQGNAYTGYLRGRYGAMTADQQAWGVHITSDPSSPESGWSTTVGPATDTLVKAGMPITAENRAAASNQAVMRQPQWARGQAVRGVSAYLGAMADESLGPNAHPLERDAFVGRMAPQLSSETVEACRAIVSEAPNGEGAALCARPDYVNSVAALMSSPDSPRKLDASTAFRNMSGVMRGSGGNTVGMQTIDVLSSNGGGGYSGGSMGGFAAPPPMAGGFGNTMVDAQYRDMTAGGGGGGFTAPGATVYAPNNSALGNTIVRGATGLNFASQSVHANVDVMPGQGNNNFNMPSNLGAQVGTGVSQTDVNVTANVVNNGGGANLPPSLGTQIGPNITQRTDINLNAAVMGDDNDVHNVDMNVTGTAGRQEMNVVGGMSGSGSINRTEMNVHAEVIAPNGPVSLPPVNQFASMQNVQSQTTASVTMGGGGGGGGGGGTYVQQGLAQVYLNPTANASQQSNYLNNQVAQMGAQAAHSYSSNYQSAQQIVIEMMRAGFDDNAIQNPGIASVAMQTYQQDPSMLGSAAIASKVMQPQEVTMESVQVVQQMVDAGWSPKNITRPDVLTSQMIVQSGAFGGAPGYGYPDPQHVRQVRQHPNFVPEYTRGAAARGAMNRIPADLLDALSGGGGGDRDRGGRR